MSGDKHSKTEAPTPKRKKEARKEGQVVRSEDLVTWTSVLLATMVMPGLVSRASEAVTQCMRLTVRIAEHPDQLLLTDAILQSFLAFLNAVLPAMLAMFVIAVAGNLAQVGFLLTGKPLKPKFSRLSPLKGLKRMFSIQSAWATLTSLLKLAIILGVSWTMVRGTASEIGSAPFRSTRDSVTAAAATTLALVRAVAASALMIGVADYAFQRRKLARDLRMTKQEIKQEAKESEGSPEVKGRQRQMRAQMSRNRMLASIQHADVVITHPTHFAIAIEYRKGAGAPRVIARGADGLAAKIKAKAAESGVPTVEAKPLARALYAVCRVGEEIPPELYQGVAIVLAFLQRLGASPRLHNGPIGLEVPDTWTPADAELVRITPARRRVMEREGAAAGSNTGDPGPIRASA